MDSARFFCKGLDFVNKYKGYWFFDSLEQRRNVSCGDSRGTWML